MFKLFALAAKRTQSGSLALWASKWPSAPPPAPDPDPRPEPAPAPDPKRESEIVCILQIVFVSLLVVAADLARPLLDIGN